VIKEAEHGRCGIADGRSLSCEEEGSADDPKEEAPRVIIPLGWEMAIRLHRRIA
jgi:hypothetical protein